MKRLRTFLLTAALALGTLPAALAQPNLPSLYGFRVDLSGRNTLALAGETAVQDPGSHHLG